VTATDTTTGSVPDAGPGVTLGDMLATGATYRQIDYWTRVGYLEPATPTPGSGTHREWTRHDLAVTRTILRLIRVGFRPEVAADFAKAAAAGRDSACVDGVWVWWGPSCRL
jgi:hypothetical protein